MRYFAVISYRGTNYSGWQVQPDSPSVQEAINAALSMVLREPILVTGCGRTDAGVHARDFVLHFWTESGLPRGLVRRLNKILDDDIVIHAMYAMHEEAHARYDADRRRYRYEITWEKNVFKNEVSWYFPYPRRPDLAAMEDVADLLLNYEDFTTFCRLHSDAKTMICTMYESRWEETESGLIYHVAANRFLRGMVRLIVGTCLEVGRGKMTIEEVKSALDEKRRLKRSISAAACGLSLVEINYPYQFENRVGE